MQDSQGLGEKEKQARGDGVVEGRVEERREKKNVQEATASFVLLVWVGGGKENAAAMLAFSRVLHLRLLLAL
jgi:hypothetical protein